MDEIVWADHWKHSFKAGSDSSSGSLKALFDIRDGNNSERNSEAPSKGLQQAQLQSAIHPLQNVNAMTMLLRGCSHD